MKVWYEHKLYTVSLAGNDEDGKPKYSIKTDKNREVRKVERRQRIVAMALMYGFIHASREDKYSTPS